jgi:two-component system, NarL family, sensor kinase
MAEAVNDASTTTNLLAQTVVQPAVAECLLTSRPASVAAMDRVVKQHVISRSLVRVKIWDAQGRIVYSDAPALIGQRFPLGAQERVVLLHPQVRADISDLRAPEKPAGTRPPQADGGVPADLDPLRHVAVV